MTEIKIRKINLSDAMEIQKISQEDLGYECSLSLVENKINSLDENREQVFVACKDGTVAGFIHIEKYDTLYFETMCNVLGLAVENGNREGTCNCCGNLGKRKWNKLYESKLRYFASRRS